MTSPADGVLVLVDPGPPRLALQATPLYQPEPVLLLQYTPVNNMPAFAMLLQ